MINEELKKYIEENIFPSYSKNDRGHDLNHIKEVIRRSLKFSNKIENINYDMVYTIASYHDIGHYINAKEHEKISSEMLYKDDNLRRFFNEKEMITMMEAVYDHRASLEYEPRSIYGKIVSSADRSTDVDDIIKRTRDYLIKHVPNITFDEIITLSIKHINEKFGKNGYANKKMYFKDEEYDKYLEEISKLVENREEFIKKYNKTL